MEIDKSLFTPYMQNYLEAHNIKFGRRTTVVGGFHHSGMLISTVIRAYKEMFGDKLHVTGMPFVYQCRVAKVMEDVINELCTLRQQAELDGNEVLQNSTKNMGNSG